MNENKARKVGDILMRIQRKYDDLNDHIVYLEETREIQIKKRDILAEKILLLETTMKEFI